ncbi:family 1 glycosylhydrolase [Microvirga brassicacearum]|uniref:Glycosyl hydrolase family protein n=1 Tax=Microvirga brassicacearum TaxID=2580413 RepID=A0A5N3P6X4_9HYPH|nr:family 1 glycosylhydrolase [Microvirga brassicacearum]KAB0265435.1 glycosyl hydrolase family protein [Microvirga brassicacearum]
MPPPRPHLSRLAERDAFWWMTGIEDTFITAPWPATGRTLDEYALTGHYDRWAGDIDLMASLGVKAARYGIPWHLVQRTRQDWDWSFADNALGRLLDRGIDPVVDLVHYGLPPWIEGAYLNPDYPDLIADYAGRLAARFEGRIRWYTPLNEPRVTAWYCGRLGWWPPYRRGWRGFIAVMMGIARGIVRTVRRLQAVDPQIVPVHVDATDLYETRDPTLIEETERRQEIVFLALDLVSGRVDPEHRLWPWLLQYGAGERDLAWFQANAVELPLIGLNLYPMFTLKRLQREGNGRFRIRQPYACGDLVAQLGRLYHERYRVPLFISETASLGSVEKRQRWMDDSLAAVRQLRNTGVPMIGYTWWPMFDLVAWAYRQGLREPAQYFARMGLWDLDPATLNRTPTSLVGSYQSYVAGGSFAVGSLELGEN